MVMRGCESDKGKVRRSTVDIAVSQVHLFAVERHGGEGAVSHSYPVRSGGGVRQISFVRQGSYGVVGWKDGEVRQGRCTTDREWIWGLGRGRGNGGSMRVGEW
jgi:hypothetical protein